MSTSASLSTTMRQLFATVGTAATVTTGLLQDVGKLGTGLSIHADDWLFETKVKSAAERKSREAEIVDEVSTNISRRISTRDEEFDRNPNLKATYDRIMPEVQQAVDEALGRTKSE